MPSPKLDRQVEINNFSVVVVGRQHNPTLVTPDFLRINHIVGEKFEAEPQSIVVSPALSRVAYKDGFELTVDPNRLRLQVAGNNAEVAEHDLVAVAREYMNTLEHIPYTAMGLNWQLYLRMGTPEQWIERTFLREAAWDHSRHHLVGAALKLRFAFDKCVCNFSLEGGHVQEADEESKDQCLVVSANFHTELTSKQQTARVAAAKEEFDRVYERKEQLEGLIDDLLAGRLQHADAHSA